MIIKDLNHPAIRDPAMAAFTNHSTEFAAQSLQLADPTIYGIEMPASNTIGQSAVCLWLVCQSNQFRYIL